MRTYFFDRCNQDPYTPIEPLRGCPEEFGFEPLPSVGLPEHYEVMYAEHGVGFPEGVAYFVLASRRVGGAEVYAMSADEFNEAVAVFCRCTAAHYVAEEPA